MKLINQDLFSSLNKTAEKSSRRRAHFNLHPELSDPVQRLCIAINPGSYIRPHRHVSPDKWELFMVFQGSAAILMFGENGQIIERTVISAKGPTYAVEIPEKKWHTLVALEEQTILVEIKQGPYSPLSDKDFAPWAPEEGTENSIFFEKQFRIAETGNIISIP